ncbi:MAG: hypothetical protein AAFR35_10540 [Pseudomonadota bacterium]
METRVGRAASYLKKHTEALVKAVGVERSAEVTGKSKATLGRYYADLDEHATRFMPIDTVAELEAEAGYPHVTTALCELAGVTVSFGKDRPNTDPDGSVNADVIALSQRFAMLMSEYHQAIEDGTITINEAKRLLSETIALQHVLMEMKLHLEDDTSN